MSTILNLQTLPLEQSLRRPPGGGDDWSTISNHC